MTDNEFNVLDELYFIIDYKELKSKEVIEENELNKTLWNLYKKEWINIYSDIDTEIFNIEKDQFFNNIEKKYFLASKQGLMKHNLC